MLSKSKYLRGKRCSKCLWLYTHKRNCIQVSDNVNDIVERGMNVGEIARSYFPNGEYGVLQGSVPSIKDVERTKSLMQDGIETIYEAAFFHNNTLVSVDLLHREPQGWHIYEVKSSTEVKSHHILDVAIQYYAVSGSGVVVSDASVMYLDNSYVRRGDLDIQCLFTHQSVLKSVMDMQTTVDSNITNNFPSMLEGDEPLIAMGSQCNSPYQCDFISYCQSLVPTPEDDPQPELSNEPQINNDEIQSFVKSLKYPICHLDFETIMPAIPLFDESRPYQQLAFQYSLHSQHAPESENIHTEYLAESKSNVDPRLGLIIQLIAETMNANTILVYNIAFERSRLREMIRDFPTYAEALEHIIDRMVDLMIPFRKKHYTTEWLGKKYSIKLVLPALCPKFSYSHLEINNGMDASNRFLSLYFSDDQQHIADTRVHLLKYCHLDTLAMVKILDVLKMV